jgi:hypothetical protein
MNEEQAAKIVADTLAWAVRQSSMPAIKDVVHSQSNEFFFTDTFSGEKFRVTVRDTE